MNSNTVKERQTIRLTFVFYLFMVPVLVSAQDTTNNKKQTKAVPAPPVTNTPSPVQPPTHQPPPWYGYYPGYFSPYNVYSDGARWLTDFLLAENLKMAYDQQQNVQSPQPEGQSAPISSTAKLALANEVTSQLAASSQGAAAEPSAGPASSGVNPPESPPPTLNPAIKVFVIGSNIDVSTIGKTTCALGPGDIVMRTDDRVGAGNTVAIDVLSSKAGDCPGNLTASIDVIVLQEAHNRFSAQIDAGLGVLANSQGIGGIPSGPRAGAFNSRDGQTRADINAQASLIQQAPQSANRN